MGEKKEGDQKKGGGGDGGDGGINTVVLKFDMHCEGCAKKVRRSIKNINGVENVKTECSAGKLTVVGKVDPVKIKERVEEKTKKKVELLSLQPNKPPTKEGGGGGGGGGGGEKKADEKKPEEKKSEGKSDDKKSEDKKEKEKPKEPQVATVVLKTRVHCEGCAQKIKKIVGKCDGVHDVNVDLQKDVITVKGTMNMKELLPYLNLKLKRNVEVAPPAKKDEGAGGGSKEKAKEGGGGGSSEKPKEGGGGTSEKGKGGGEKKVADEGSASKAENVTKIEVNKMEYNPYAYGFGAHAYTYDPRQHGESYSHQVSDYWHQPEYSHPPQMFSDENPNACSVM